MRKRAARVQLLLREEETVGAVEVADRARRLRQQVEGRRHQSPPMPLPMSTTPKTTKSTVITVALLAASQVFQPSSTRAALSPMAKYTPTGAMMPRLPTDEQDEDHGLLCAGESGCAMPAAAAAQRTRFFGFDAGEQRPDGQRSPA